MDEENISVEFFKKFNYFTTMYDWDEFKDIENKPKKVDILNAFLRSYMLACKINKKTQEENKAMKQKHSQEPSKTKSPELKRLDPGSKMYDKYNCEFIRDLAEYFETNHEFEYP